MEDTDLFSTSLGLAGSMDGGGHYTCGRMDYRPVEMYQPVVEEFQQVSTDFDLSDTMEFGPPSVLSPVKLDCDTVSETVRHCDAIEENMSSHQSLHTLTSSGFPSCPVPEQRYRDQGGQSYHDLSNQSNQSYHDLNNQSNQSYHDLNNQSNQSYHDLSNQSNQSYHDLSNQSNQSYHDLNNQSNHSYHDPGEQSYQNPGEQAYQDPGSVVREERAKSEDGPGQYTSLCLVGSPSSTMAEYQSESSSYQTGGTYTLLETKKDKEAGMEREMQMLNSTTKDTGYNMGSYSRPAYNDNSSGYNQQSSYQHKFPHVCQICGKSFPWKTMLDSHMTSHSDPASKPFQCDICGKCFRNHGFMLSHKKMHQTENMCGTSSSMYGGSGGGGPFMDQLRQNQEPIPRHDGMYGGDMYRQNNYQPTARSSYSERDPSQDFQNRGFYGNHDMMKQDKINAIGKDFKCEFCPRMFSRFGNLRNHMSIVHSQDSVASPSSYKPNMPVAPHSMNGALNAEDTTCLVCKKMFTSSDDLKLHFLNQHRETEETYRCGPCDQVFTGQFSSFQQHMRTAHNGSGGGSGSFPCQHCDRVFSNKHQLTTHMSAEHKKQFQCDLCFESFSRETQLKIHYASHTGQKPFTCEQCNKGYTSHAGLKHHLLSHDSQPLICNLCSKSLSSKARMDRHMLQVHSGNSLVRCPVCGIPFSRLSYMTTHLRETHRDSPRERGARGRAWGTRGRRGPGRDKQLAHRYMGRGITQKRHWGTRGARMNFLRGRSQRGFAKTSSLKPRGWHSREWGNSCETCGKAFVSLVRLRKHKCPQFSSGRGRRKLGQKVRKFNRKTHPYECDLCWRCFAQPHKLRQHKEEHFINDANLLAGPKIFAQVYKCDVCKLKLPSEEDLLEHRNSHFDAAQLTKFECEVCGEGFARKRDLKLHDKVHKIARRPRVSEDDDIGSSEKIYECDICEEMFSSQVELQIHDEVHCISPTRELKTKDNMDKMSSRRGRGGNRRGRIIAPLSKQIELTLNTERKGRLRSPGCVQRESRSRIRHSSTSSTGERRSTRTRNGQKMLMSETEDQFPCQECVAHFSTLQEYRDHMVFHKDEKPHECIICYEYFWSKNTLKFHMETHQGEKSICKICGNCYKNFDDLENHISEDHATIALTKKRGTKVKAEKSICNENFDDLENHISEEHATMAPTNRRGTKVKGNHGYSCVKCGMVFQEPAHLKAHEMIHVASVRLTRRVTRNSRGGNNSEIELLCKDVKCEIEVDMTEDETVSVSFTKSRTRTVKKEIREDWKMISPGRVKVENTIQGQSCFGEEAKVVIKNKRVKKFKGSRRKRPRLTAEGKIFKPSLVDQDNLDEESDVGETRECKPVVVENDLKPIIVDIDEDDKDANDSGCQGNISDTCIENKEEVKTYINKEESMSESNEPIMKIKPKVEDIAQETTKVCTVKATLRSTEGDGDPTEETSEVNSEETNNRKDERCSKKKETRSTKINGRGSIAEAKSRSSKAEGRSTEGKTRSSGNKEGSTEIKTKAEQSKDSLTHPSKQTSDLLDDRPTKTRSLKPNTRGRSIEAIAERLGTTEPKQSGKADSFIEKTCKDNGPSTSSNTVNHLGKDSTSSVISNNLDSSSKEKSGKIDSYHLENSSSIPHSALEGNINPSGNSCNETASSEEPVVPVVSHLGKSSIEKPCLEKADASLSETICSETASSGQADANESIASHKVDSCNEPHPMEKTGTKKSIEHSGAENTNPSNISNAEINSEPSISTEASVAAITSEPNNSTEASRDPITSEPNNCTESSQSKVTSDPTTPGDAGRAFKCSVCDVFFAKCSSLETHLGTHTETARPQWRLHVVQTAQPTYVCVHIEHVAKSCAESYDNL